MYMYHRNLLLLACFSCLAWTQTRPLAGIQAAETGSDEFGASEVMTPFWKLDVDADGRLTREEYVQPHRDQPSEAEARVESVRLDRNRDRLLTLVEFSAGRIAPEMLFSGLDEDGDGLLTRDEFLQHCSGESQRSCRSVFYKADANGDEQLSLDEFVRQGVGAEISTTNEFRRRDLNNDGRLSPEEYYQPNIGTKWEQKARREAVEYDLDRDGFLNLVEFALAPPANARPEALFEILDADGDQQLTRNEFLERYASSEQARATQSFSRADASADGRLSRDEYMGMIYRAPTTAAGRFRERDLNTDDRLSPQEYYRPNVGTKWEQKARQEAVEYDLDRDGFLNLVEFALAPPANARPEALFEILDTDGDQQLTRDEFLERYASSEQARATQSFSRADADTDGRLSREEYMGMVRSAPKTVAEQFRARDMDEDRRLSREEYYQPNIGTKWEHKASQEAVEYDLDQDGFLNLVEFALAPPARTKPEALFEILDADRDQELARDEFLQRYAPNEQARATQSFSRADANTDGRLSRSEYVAMIHRPPKTAAERFRARDLNADGRLSPQEYYQPNIGTKWEQKARREAVEYDVDRDGFLSLIEFALAPPARTKPEALFEILDADRDQKLARDEFLRRYASNEQALAAAVFARADADADGRLSLYEWRRRGLNAPRLDDSGIVMREVPVEAIFAARDKDGDGFLLFPDVFTEKHPSSSNPGKLQEYQRRLMRAEESFAAADLNRDSRLSMEEFQDARQPKAPAATYVAARRAETRERGINWLMIGFVSADVAVLAGVGLLILRRKRQ